MTQDEKAILLELANDAEFLRARCQYLGTLLSRLGVRTSPYEEQDGMSLAIQGNRDSYDALRKRIEAL